MLKKYLIKGFLLVVLFMLLVGVKAFYLQRSHFLAAEKYYAEANWKLAIREYDTAMHFYTPWSPYIEKSALKLWEIGEMFEKENKLDWANIAYSSIRSSFYASRSLYTPGKDWINKCDEKIADLNVKMLVQDGSILPKDADAEKAKHLYVMKVDRAPKPLRALLVVASFLGWIGSVLFIIFKGFHDDGRINRRLLLSGSASLICTFVIWIIAMLNT